MPAFSGKTLWFSALALWLTASPADAVETDDKAWAYDVVHSHVQQTKAWPKSDYHLGIEREDADRIYVYVRHREDDETFGKLNSDGFIRAGGGKSFEVYLSRKTHSVIGEWYFQ